MRSARREDLMDRVSWITRMVTTVAALVLFGVTVGWLGRERYIVSPVATVNQGSPIRAVASEGPQLPSSGPVTVLVEDGTGKTIPVQFHSMEEATRFLQDFKVPQSAAPTGADSPIVPAMDKF